MKKLALLFVIVLMLSGCSVKSAEEYYKETEAKGKNTAVISINCQTAIDYGKDMDRVNPEILPETKVAVNEGDSVFDALKSVCKKNELQFEYDGSGDSLYIKGIDYLYEFDCGELSGWEYRVNGEFPSVGCNAFKLKDGDKIEWLYTCKLGEDIGDKNGHD